MSQSEKTGIIGGTVGATIGCITWMIIAGIAARSPLLVALPLVCGLVCVVSVAKLYNLYPERKFAIMGLAIFWLAIWNFFLGNIMYDKIPHDLWWVSSDKGELGVLKLNIAVAVVSILGFYFVVRDILRSNKRL